MKIMCNKKVVTHAFYHGERPNQVHSLFLSTTHSRSQHKLIPMISLFQGTMKWNSYLIRKNIKLIKVNHAIQKFG